MSDLEVTIPKATVLELRNRYASILDDRGPLERDPDIGAAMLVAVLGGIDYGIRTAAEQAGLGTIRIMLDDGHEMTGAADARPPSGTV